LLGDDNLKLAKGEAVMINKLCSTSMLLVTPCVSITSHAVSPAITALQQQVNQLNSDVGADVTDIQVSCVGI